MNYNQFTREQLEHKIRKYHMKIAELTEKKNAMSGGAKKEDAPKKETVKKETPKKDAPKKDKNEKKVRKERPEAKNVLRVECVEVDQNKADLKYSARTCRTPPMNIRLTHDENPWSYIVKIILNYVNKRLRTKDVTEVEYVVGKKSTKVAGDKLGETKIDVTKIGDIQELKIKLQ